MISTVLFDLDGTLLDTAPDIGNALNQVRHAHKLPPIAHPLIRPFVGYGASAMIKFAFDIDEEHPRYTQLLDELLHAYHDHLTRTTRLFPGMEEVLCHLEKNNIPWGIVTNKQSRFTYDLLKALALDHRSACIICGDSLSKRKPHPDQILHACELIKCKPSETLYVGDTSTDVTASKAAGTKSLVALYGYIKAEEDPHSWKADGYVKEPVDIIEWLAATV